MGSLFQGAPCIMLYKTPTPRIDSLILVDSSWNSFSFQSASIGLLAMREHRWREIYKYAIFGGR